MPLHHPADPARSNRPPFILSALEAHGALPSPTGRPAYTQTLPCAPESARRARLLVSAACTAWELAGLVDSATLIVSELLANSVEHSGSRLVRVVVSHPEHGRVRVAVADNSRTQPTPRTAPDNAEDGRGLAVVQALADRWGTDVRRWGKLVWAECATAERATKDKVREP
ncbi:ATP-binding protein [Streptomyces paludis]|uniref:ATP-binding protein n=1 Tax=Streptomyces paludis TaxID=2282738 RepID=A0A345HNK3_9ACTN|nr:ATP-binding protein [Streptomyces paludis]AXG78277.1 ATP-binding protein [Streptomyces paludis]